MHARGVPARRAVPAADGRGRVERPALGAAERVGAEAAGAARLPRIRRRSIVWDEWDDERFESRRRGRAPDRPRGGVPIPLRRRRHARGARESRRRPRTTVHVRRMSSRRFSRCGARWKPSRRNRRTDGGDARRGLVERTSCASGPGRTRGSWVRGRARPVRVEGLETEPIGTCGCGWCWIEPGTRFWTHPRRLARFATSTLTEYSRSSRSLSSLQLEATRSAATGSRAWPRVMICGANPAGASRALSAIGAPRPARPFGELPRLAAPGWTSTSVFGGAPSEPPPALAFTSATNARILLKNCGGSASYTF